MKFDVQISPVALAEAEEAYLWLRSRSPMNADRWYLRLMEAVESLSSQPTRCSLAPEYDAFPTEVRQLLFGKRSGIYRILFSITENKVRVLHIRHGARTYLEQGRSSEEVNE